MSKALKIITIKDKNKEKSLRQISKEVPSEEIISQQFQKFLDNLLYTAQHSEEQGNVPAGGIAAVQVGEHKRVFFILNYDTNLWEVFINPKIEIEEFLKTTTKEGCLSVPDILGDVTRYLKIKVKYQNKEGIWETKRYEGLNAVSIQHELDHLEGVLFIDKMEK